MEEAIRFEHISKRFPGVRALNDVSFNVHAGEVHALLGENGAGKSTLLNILHGIYQATEGKVTLLGKEVHFKTPNEAIANGISKVHQEINVIKDLTVGQNITLGQEIKKGGIFVDYKKTNDRVNELLEQLHCRFTSDTLVLSLTAGEMQMLAIAKALYNNSRVISFDEPTASLTDAETKSLFNIIAELKSKGITVLYVSHRLEEIFQICDRATILRDGTFVTTLNVADTNRKELITYMAGREIDSDMKTEAHSFNSTEVLLQVKNFSGGNKFNNVSFDLHRGEILGFFGLVGAGRTEVMRAIFGADKIKSGEMYMDGKKIYARNTQEGLHNGFGLLPEERKTQGFVNLMHNVDNASLSVLPKYSKFGFINKKALLENYLEKSEDLRVHPEDPFFLTANLSGGNQQKVILARWLSTDSKILIFDEPTKGIDVATKIEIYKLMDNARKNGKSIIMISSELPEIMRVSDRIIVMYEGEITATLQNTNDLKDNEILEYAMGGKQK